MSKNGRPRSGSGSKKMQFDDDEGEDSSGNGHSYLDRKRVENNERPAVTFDNTLGQRHQISFQTRSRGTIQENSTSTLSSGSTSDDPTPTTIPVPPAPLHARESQPAPWLLQNSPDQVLSIAVQRLLSQAMEATNNASVPGPVPLPASFTVPQPGLTSIVPPSDATSRHQATMMVKIITQIPFVCQLNLIRLSQLLMSRI